MQIEKPNMGLEGTQVLWWIAGFNIFVTILSCFGINLNVTKTRVYIPLRLTLITYNESFNLLNNETFRTFWSTQARNSLVGQIYDKI